MTEINKLEPIKILSTKAYTFVLDLDTRKFGEYTRQGVVENKKVIRELKFHDLAQSYLNPAVSSPEGMLPVCDLAKFGRSDNLHISLRAIHTFHTKHKRYPEIGDSDEISQLSKNINIEAKKNGEFSVDDLDDEVIRKASMFATSSLVP